MLPPDQNPMQLELDSFNEYCTQYKLSINQEKSKSMLFNKARKHDFSPELFLTPGTKLEVVEEMRLVGYQLRSDLRTISNTEYIVQRAWKRMWVIRRLKALGASEQELLNVLRAQVISILQFASPAWSTLITVKEGSQIESVLKTGLFLVYEHRFQSFSWALNEAKMKNLQDQRTKTFQVFTRKCIADKKFQKWFVLSDATSGSDTRQKPKKYKPVPTRTQGFARSAIPQMVELANSQQFQQSNNNIVLKSGKIIVF